MDMTATVASLQESEAELLAGNMRLRRPITDLEVLAGAEAPAGRVKAAPSLPPGVQVHLAGHAVETNEVNLLGCTADEAVDRTDKFLDDAFLAHLPEVRIVHGMGTGALRNAIADLLRNHPHVARFEPAPPSAGGRGVTIATLRD
jgi:DNA mismatch repair protein MutS2